MIQDNLENKMLAHISQTGRDVSVIIMHPQTWVDLVAEIVKNNSVAISYDKRYKGRRTIKWF